MRRGTAIIVAPLLLAGLFSSACSDSKDDQGASPTVTAAPTSGAPQELQLTDEDNGADVRLTFGGTLIVALASNPSTGFSWSVTPPEPAGLEIEGEPRYVPPGSTTPVVGAAGTQVFTFKTTARGASQVTLTYARSFEPGAAGERTFKVTVNIE